MNARGRFWLIVASLVAVLAIALYAQIEWVEREIDVGNGEEASRNDFYAAELFLGKHGVATETVTGMALLDELPGTEDLLLLSASRESLSVRRRDALVAWVERGGELLVVAHSVYDGETGSSDDPLLDELGIFLIEPEEEEDADLEAEEEVEAEAAKEAEAAAAAEDGQGALPESDEVSASDGAEENEDDADSDPPDVDSLPKTIAELLAQSTERESCIEDPERLTEVGTASGESLLLELSAPNGLAVYNERLDDAYFSSDAQVLSMPVGEGQIVALTSIQPFLNRRIHCHDHAYFLWFTASDRDKVWLLHDPDVPTLARLAWENLPLTTVGGFLLVVLVGAMASLRFGVAQAEDEPPRRELREHLEASVTFHFRKGGFAALFLRLRNDLLGRGALDRERWAERAGVTPAEAEGALVGAVPLTRREILRRVQTMLRMRRTK